MSYQFEKWNCILCGGIVSVPVLIDDVRMISLREKALKNLNVGLGGFHWLLMSDLYFHDVTKKILFTITSFPSPMLCGTQSSDEARCHCIDCCDVEGETTENSDDRNIRNNCYKQQKSTRPNNHQYFPE